MDTHGFKDETSQALTPEVIEEGPYNPAPVNFEKRTTSMLVRAQAFRINNDQDYAQADHLVSEAAALVKGIKKLHDPVIAAANKAHKMATGLRKKLIDPVNESSRMIVNEMASYRLEREKQIAEERKLLEEKARHEQEQMIDEEIEEMKEQGFAPDVIDSVSKMKDDPIAVPASTIPELRGKTSFSTDWKIEVVDKSLVPDHYKQVMENAVLSAVKYAKGEIEIPGIKIIQTQKARRKSL